MIYNLIKIMIYNLIKRSIIIDSLNIKGLQFTPSDSKDTGTTEFKFEASAQFISNY